MSELIQSEMILRDAQTATDQQPQTQVFPGVPIEILRRVSPFSRHPWRQGQNHFKPLRQQLIHAPISTIDFPGQRIIKCIEMAAAFSSPDFTDRVCKRLAARFGMAKVRLAWLNAMAFQRRFDEAFHWARDYARTHPDDIDAQLSHAKFAMLAGHPEAMLRIYKEQLGAAIAHRPKEYHGMIDVLVQAGEAVWVDDNFPETAQDIPAVRQAKKLSSPTAALKIFCISLEKDYRRMAGTRRFLNGGGVVNWVNAVPGKTLPKSVAKQLIKCGADEISSAEIGCSLSHLSAWEQVAESCAPDEYALIVEDDARFMFGPGKGLAEVEKASRNRDAGLVFINISACWEALGAKGADAPEVFPVDHRFNPDVPEGPPHNPGWGAYGYLVNGKTARLLTDIWMDVGILGALDWQLFMMCFGTLSPWQDRRITRTIYHGLTARGTWPKIPGYVCNMPIMHTRDFGFSSINAGN